MILRRIFCKNQYVVGDKIELFKRGIFRGNLYTLRRCSNVQVDVIPRSKTCSFGFTEFPQSQTFEGKYFEEVMENNPNYPECVFNESILLLNKKSTNRLVKFLRDVVENSEKYKKLNESLDFNRMNYQNDSYTLDDLIEIFYLLFILKKIAKQEVFVKDLFEFLGYKAKNLKAGADINKVLRVLNVIGRTFPQEKNASFFLATYVLNKFKKLTNVQMVEYFYFIYRWRRMLKVENNFYFENLIVKKVPELTLDELAVISMAYFRSRICPGTELTLSISERLLKDMENANDVQMETIAKFIQKSGRRRVAENVGKLLRKFILNIQKFSLITAVHMACMGVNINVGNEDLIKAVIQRAKKEVDQIRLKDIERLLLATIFFNIDINKNSDFVKLIKEGLETRKSEINLHPRSLLSYLNYLIIHGIFLEDYISLSLSEEFVSNLRKVYGHNVFRELLFIDASTALERPNYNGNRLSVKLQNKISRAMVFKENESQITSSWKCTEDLIDVLGNIYGSDCHTIKRLLPHYSTYHPVLCINQDNEPQKIGDKLQATNDGIIRAPNDGNKWICFTFLRWQNCLEDHITPNFGSKAKLKHLEIIGYIPVMMFNFLWQVKTKEEKLQFVRDIILEKLKIS